MPALPIFPLGTIAVPGFAIGLQIFEPRYLRLLSDLGDLPELDRLFGVLAIRRGHEVGAGQAGETYAVGTAVRVGPLALDGRVVRLQPVGVRRFRVLRHLADDPYPRAEVTWLDDVPGTDAEGLERIASELRVAYAAYAKATGLTGASDVGEHLRHADPAHVAYAVLAGLPLPLAQRQAALEAEATAERLSLLLRLLQGELALVTRFRAVHRPPDLGGAGLN